MPYTYWYAIIAAPPTAGASGRVPAVWGDGLHGSALRLAAAGELAAVVSDWTPAAVNRSFVEVDADLVWQHEHVMERIMYDCTVLPVRFGTLLANDERVRSALVERQDVFKADLARVAGCIELGLRILWQPPADGAQMPANGAQASSPAPAVLHRQARAPALHNPGAQYLLRRAAEEQTQQAVRREAEALAGAVCCDLDALALEVRRSVLPTDRLLLSANYLIPRVQMGSFITAVEQLRAQHRQLAFMWSGPWPPYHFMSA